MPIEVFLIIFTVLIAGFLPVLVLIFSIISLSNIYQENIKLLDMFYFGSSVLLFLIVSTYWFAKQNLNETV